MKSASFIDAVIERRKAMKRINGNHNCNNHVRSSIETYSNKGAANKLQINKRERQSDNNNDDDNDGLQK